MEERVANFLSEATVQTISFWMEKWLASKRSRAWIPIELVYFFRCRASNEWVTLRCWQLYSINFITALNIPRDSLIWNFCLNYFEICLHPKHFGDSCLLWLNGLVDGVETTLTGRSRARGVFSKPKNLAKLTVKTRLQYPSLWMRILPLKSLIGPSKALGSPTNSVVIQYAMLLPLVATTRAFSSYAHESPFKFAQSAKSSGTCLRRDQREEYFWWRFNFLGYTHASCSKCLSPDYRNSFHCRAKAPVSKGDHIGLYGSRFFTLARRCRKETIRRRRQAIILRLSQSYLEGNF